MKRVLIYASTGPDAADLATLHSLTQRLLQSPSGVELTIISEEPLQRRSRENPAARHVTLPRVNAPAGTRQTADAPRPSFGAVLQDRAQTIRRTIAEFAPDLIVVDGSPFGQYDELARILATPWPVQIGPQWVLLLRDLLGCRARAPQIWRERGYFDAIVSHYTKVLVLGERDIFDLERDYEMPAAVVAKLEYCGYVTPEPGRSVPGRLRRALGVPQGQALVVVSPGPGPDGEALIRDIVTGLRALPPDARPRCHIVCGEQMRESERFTAACFIHGMPCVSLQHGSRDTMSLLAAADVVVADAGYRKICELLASRRRAVVVPGLADAPEQTARARRLAELGLLRWIDPRRTDPNALLAAVRSEIELVVAQPLTPLRSTADAIEFVATTLHNLLEFEPECISDANSRGVARSLRRRTAPPIDMALRKLVDSDFRAGGLRRP